MSDITQSLFTTTAGARSTFLRIWRGRILQQMRQSRITCPVIFGYAVRRFRERHGHPPAPRWESIPRAGIHALLRLVQKRWPPDPLAQPGWGASPIDMQRVPRVATCAVRSCESVHPRADMGGAELAVNDPSNNLVDKLPCSRVRAGAFWS